MGLGRDAYAANKIGESGICTHAVKFRPAPKIETGLGFVTCGMLRVVTSLEFLRIILRKWVTGMASL